MISADSALTTVNEEPNSNDVSFYAVQRAEQAVAKLSRYLVHSESLSTKHLLNEVDIALEVGGLISNINIADSNCYSEQQNSRESSKDNEISNLELDEDIRIFDQTMEYLRNIPDRGTELKRLTELFKKLKRENQMHVQYISQLVDMIHHHRENLHNPHSISLKTSKPVSNYTAENRQLFSIGQNDDGQLGLNSNESDGGIPCSSKFRLIAPISQLESHVIVKLVCGSMFCLAITEMGQCYTWGLEELVGRDGGELPGLVANQVVDAAATEYSALILTSNGDLLMWGAFRDSNGKLLATSNVNRIKIPTKIPTIQNVVQISGGESHYAALTSDGKLYTWGIGEYGQLGRPFSAIRCYNGSDLVPTYLWIDIPIYTVYCCGFSTFICGPFGVYASGKNGFGELGLGDFNPRVSFTQVEALNSMEIVKIVGGMHHVLFLDKSGKVYGAGRNDDGQLGLGEDFKCASTPIQIPVSLKIKDIGAGVSSHHSYLIDTFGNLWGSGQNQYSQLGSKDEILYSFQQIKLKSRRCLFVAGGCQFTIASLTNGNTQ